MSNSNPPVIKLSNALAATIPGIHLVTSTWQNWAEDEYLRGYELALWVATRQRNQFVVIVAGGEHLRAPCSVGASVGHPHYGCQFRDLTRKVYLLEALRWEFQCYRVTIDYAAWIVEQATCVLHRVPRRPLTVASPEGVSP